MRKDGICWNIQIQSVTFEFEKKNKQREVLEQSR